MGRRKSQVSRPINTATSRTAHETSVAALNAGIALLDAFATAIRLDGPFDIGEGVEAASNADEDEDEHVATVRAADRDWQDDEVLEAISAVLDEQADPPLEFALGVLGAKPISGSLGDRTRNAGMRAFSSSMRNRKIARKRGSLTPLAVNAPSASVEASEAPIAGLASDPAILDDCSGVATTFPQYTSDAALELPPPAESAPAEPGLPGDDATLRVAASMPLGHAAEERGTADDEGVSVAADLNPSERSGRALAQSQVQIDAVEAVAATAAEGLPAAGSVAVLTSEPVIAIEEDSKPGVMVARDGDAMEIEPAGVAENAELAKETGAIDSSADALETEDSAHTTAAKVMDEAQLRSLAPESSGSGVPATPPAASEAVAPNLVATESLPQMISEPSESPDNADVPVTTDTAQSMAETLVPAVVPSSKLLSSGTGKDSRRSSPNVDLDAELPATVAPVSQTDSGQTIAQQVALSEETVTARPLQLDQPERSETEPMSQPNVVPHSRPPASEVPSASESPVRVDETMVENADAASGNDGALPGRGLSPTEALPVKSSAVVHLDVAVQGVLPTSQSDTSDARTAPTLPPVPAPSASLNPTFSHVHPAAQQLTPPPPPPPPPLPVTTSVPLPQIKSGSHSQRRRNAEDSVGRTPRGSRAPEAPSGVPPPSNNMSVVASAPSKAAFAGKDAMVDKASLLTSTKVRAPVESSDGKEGKSEMERPSKKTSAKASSLSFVAAADPVSTTRSPLIGAGGRNSRERRALGQVVFRTRGRRASGASEAEMYVKNADAHMVRCYQVWKKINEDKFSLPFRLPVNPRDAPGYFDTITEPMDLRTIRQQFEDGTLSTPREFARTMRLIYQNAMQYNSPDSDLYDLANEFRQRMAVEMKPIIGDWREETGAPAEPTDDDDGMVVAPRQEKKSILERGKGRGGFKGKKKTAASASEDRASAGDDEVDESDGGGGQDGEQSGAGVIGASNTTKPVGKKRCRPSEKGPRYPSRRPNCGADDGDDAEASEDEPTTTKRARLSDSARGSGRSGSADVEGTADEIDDDDNEEAEDKGVPASFDDGSDAEEEEGDEGTDEAEGMATKRNMLAKGKYSSSRGGASGRGRGRVRGRGRGGASGSGRGGFAGGRGGATASASGVRGGSGRGRGGRGAVSTAGSGRKPKRGGRLSTSGADGSDEVKKKRTVSGRARRQSQ
jgi:hypothetical protein